MFSVLSIYVYLVPNLSRTIASAHLKNNAPPVYDKPWTRTPLASTDKPEARKADPVGIPTGYIPIVVVVVVVVVVKLHTFYTIGSEVF